MELLELPDNELSAVLDRCSGAQLASLAQTCRRLRALVDGDAKRWRAACTGWRHSWWQPPSGAASWKQAWLRRTACDMPVNRLLLTASMQDGDDVGCIQIARSPHDSSSSSGGSDDGGSAGDHALSARPLAVKPMTLPHWCPFGKHIAYVVRPGVHGKQRYAVTVARLFGDNLRLLPVLEFGTNSEPFFLAWTPDGQHVSFLTPRAGEDIALRVVPLSAFTPVPGDDAGSSRRPGRQLPTHPLDGQGGDGSDAWCIVHSLPLFYDFSPVREHVVMTHGGAMDMRLVSYNTQPDGAPVQSARNVPVWCAPDGRWRADAFPLANLDRLQLFQAPSYTPDGKHVLFVSIQVHEPDGLSFRLLLTCAQLPSREAAAQNEHMCTTSWILKARDHQGGVEPLSATRFAVSPDARLLVWTKLGGRLVRLIHLADTLARDLGSSQAAGQCTCGQVVHDDSGDDLVLDASVAAFLWSPCSRYLLVLTEEATPLVAGQWRKWQVWSMAGEPRRLFSTDEVLLTSAMEHILLPFYEQYFRTTCTLWAPDSSAFCYAAMDMTSGDNACFVQQLPEGEAEAPPPRIVDTGNGARFDMVFWSPQ